jgi:hypothetical protein
MVKKNAILLFILTILSIQLALRNDKTPDTAEYKLIYENSIDDHSSIEFLYISFNRFCNEIGLSFTNYLLIVTYTLFIGWYNLTKQITNNLLLAFIVFLPFYGFYFYGIILRAAIAVTICYLAIIILLKFRGLKKYILYYLLIFIASGFHLTAMLFLVLPIIAQKHYKNRSLYLFLIYGAFLPLFNNYIPIIKEISFKYLALFEFNRVEGYLSRASEEMMYSINLFKHLIFGGIFIFLRNRVIEKQAIYNFFLNIYLIGCFLLALFSFVTAGGRVGIMFLFFEFTLFSLLYESSNIKKMNISIFIIVSVIINFVAIIRQGNGLIW